MGAVVGIASCAAGSARRPRRPPPRSSLMYGLYDLVTLEPFLAALGAEAGILDPAERRIGARDGKGVDADHAALDKVTDEVGPAAVFGECECSEAEGQAV